MKTILLFSLFTLPLFAQDFTFDKETNTAIPKHFSEIEEFKGKVFKKSGTKIIDVEIGTRFAKGDSIVTKDKSFAKLTMVDDSTMTVSENSELKFSEIKFVDKSNRSMLFDFVKGQIRGMVKNKAKDNDIRIRTKVAVLGVRGTEILANHQTLPGHEISEFALLSGKAVVDNDKLGSQNLEKHQRVVIIDNVKDKVIDDEQSVLSADELKLLDTEDGFMPFYALKATTSEKKATEESNTAAAESADASDKTKKNWRENLKKLNEELKKNQKK